MLLMHSYGDFNTEIEIEFLKSIGIEESMSIWKKILLNKPTFTNEIYVTKKLDEFKGVRRLFLSQIGYHLTSIHEEEYYFLLKYLIGIEIVGLDELDSFEKVLMSYNKLYYKDLLFAFSDDYKLYHALSNYDIDLIRYFFPKCTDYIYHNKLFSRLSLDNMEDYQFEEICKVFKTRENVFELFLEEGNDTNCNRILIIFPEYLTYENFKLSIENSLLETTKTFLNNNFEITQKLLEGITILSNEDEGGDMYNMLEFLENRGFDINNLANYEDIEYMKKNKYSYLIKGHIHENPDLPENLTYIGTPFQH